MYVCMYEFIIKVKKNHLCWLVSFQRYDLKIGYDYFNADEILKKILPSELEVPSSFEQVFHTTIHTYMHTYIIHIYITYIHIKSHPAFFCRILYLHTHVNTYIQKLYTTYIHTYINT